MAQPLPDRRKHSESSQFPRLTVREGYLLDYVSQKEKKETPKELVRQRVARGIVHELHINPDDMETDATVSYTDAAGKNQRKKVDLVIYQPGSHPETRGFTDVARAVIIKSPPNIGKRSVAKLRDHRQAAKDLDELKDVMSTLPNCTYGMWTNGLDFFHLKKEQGLFEDTFKPLAFWPQVDETFSIQDHASTVRLRSGDAESLKTAFRRCHNFIHGNEGMPKDAAFWQFLYLIFSKIHDERRLPEDRRFLAGPDEQYSEEGRKAIRSRVEPIFDAVKQAFPGVFVGNEQITLSDRALAFLVSELAKYDFSRSDVDVKGAAYQELVGANLRGDRGQYFTPKSVVNLAVEILDPKPDERVLDPACGTGGFLVSTLAHQLSRFRKWRDQSPEDENTREFNSVLEQLRDYANRFVFGADFDPFLVRAAKMNVVLASQADGNIYHIDSLAFPNGYLDSLEDAKRRIPLGSIDVLLTNPPFGADIPITDPALLRDYKLAQSVEKVGDRLSLSGKYISSVAPETLFVEKCVKWLKPGGRMAIVLPNGLLSNPGEGATAIRQWILEQCWVLASVEVPIEAFIVEAGVNILTSVLFLKKKTEAEKKEERLAGSKDYPVFMAVAETSGFDRRGNTLYKRAPDGTEIVETKTVVERIRVNGGIVEREVTTPEKVEDNDLKLVSAKYSEFRQQYPEPGSAHP